MRLLLPHEELNKGLGLEYLNEVQNLINFLIRYPEAGQVVQGSIRRIILPKFPYSLMYRLIENGQIRILAIAQIKFYQSIGFTVEDVSLKQVTESSNKDWKDYDLRLNRHEKTLYVDVKNARTTFSNRNNDKKGYSEFCVQKFKKNRNKDEIIIAGVLSPYVKLEQIKEPSYPNTSPIIFMGEITKKQINQIENHFSNQLSSVIMPRDTEKMYLPPWLFDYPIEPFYSQRK